MQYSNTRCRSTYAFRSPPLQSGPVAPHFQPVGPVALAVLEFQLGKRNMGRSTELYPIQGRPRGAEREKLRGAKCKIFTGYKYASMRHPNGYKGGFVFNPCINSFQSRSRHAEAHDDGSCERDLHKFVDGFGGLWTG